MNKKQILDIFFIIFILIYLFILYLLFLFFAVLLTLSFFFFLFLLSLSFFFFFLFQDAMHLLAYRSYAQLAGVAAQKLVHIPIGLLLKFLFETMEMVLFFSFFFIKEAKKNITKNYFLKKKI